MLRFLCIRSYALLIISAVLPERDVMMSDATELRESLNLVYNSAIAIGCDLSSINAEDLCVDVGAVEHLSYQVVSNL